jgi:ankyrin repeat protein
MNFGANRINYLLSYTKEKRDLINNCEDQSIEKFKQVVSEHFPTKQQLEQLHLLVCLIFIQQGATLILHAVANKSPKIIKYLIEERGYSVDLVSKNKETALMRAVVENNIELTTLLLTYKPNLGLVNQVTITQDRWI